MQLDFIFSDRKQDIIYNYSGNSSQSIFSSGFPVLLPVVQQVATLTERRKVLRPVVRPVMVQMRDRQDDPEHSVSAQ